MLERFPATRVLLLFFGFLVRSVEDQFEPLKRDIHGARFATTYHNYLARTMIYAIGSFVAVLAVLVVASVVLFRPATFGAVGSVLLLFGYVFPSVVVSYLVYRVRLWYPEYVADERARAIELSMPNITNFLLALSRAGVPTRESMRVISEHADVLGEAANEVRYAYRDMEYFGADVVAALRYLSDTTNLEELTDFLDGYLRALTGRGDVDRFLEQQMQNLFEKAELEQEDFLQSLGVLAEVYVAVFVAGPIFALIILVVMGFVGAEGVLVGIRLVVYAMIPLTALGFLVLLDIYMTNPLTGAGTHRSLEVTDLYDLSLREVATHDRGEPDAIEAQTGLLERYMARQKLVRFLAAPLTLLRRNPMYALLVGIAGGVIYAGIRVGLSIVVPSAPFVTAIPADGSITDVVRVIDDPIVEAIILALGFYTLFYELRARYLDAVENSLPDFLTELSNRHQIGMSLSESITALHDRDMGRIDDEVRRMSRDFAMNANASDVLRRFANRVRSPVVTRVVVLLAAANDTADRLGPVIEALAERAKLAQRLKRERRVEMSLYVVIIYISFFVFLVILTILNDVFLPKVPTEGLGAGGVVSSEGFDPVEYRTVFFHMSVVQGFFSGLVGGKMSEGTISAGAKHALLMVIIAYVLFVLVLPNVTITV